MLRQSRSTMGVERMLHRPGTTTRGPRRSAPTPRHETRHAPCTPRVRTIALAALGPDVAIIDLGRLSFEREPNACLFSGASIPFRRILCRRACRALPTYGAYGNGSSGPAWVIVEAGERLMRRPSRRGAMERRSRRGRRSPSQAVNRRGPIGETATPARRYGRSSGCAWCS
jgi:hypothetical protein